jgi:hypothetical protein
MAEVVLYQSVIQKLGQLNPDDLSQLDAFLTALIGQSHNKKRKKGSKDFTISPIDYLEALAKIGGVSAIENPVEWQYNSRQDRVLPYR